MKIKYFGQTEAQTANTGLAKVAVQCSASTSVMKIPTYAKAETVTEGVTEGVNETVNEGVKKLTFLDESELLNNTIYNL